MIKFVCICWLVNLLEGIFARTSIQLATTFFEFRGWFMVLVEIGVSGSRNNTRVLEVSRTYA